MISFFIWDLVIMKLNKGFIIIEVLVSLMVVAITIEQIVAIKQHEFVILQISDQLR